MGRYRAALRRLDRVLLVAVFLLGALLAGSATLSPFATAAALRISTQ